MSGASIISTSRNVKPFNLDLYRSAIPVSDACQKANVQIIGGKITCPLHQESHPSMQVFHDHLYCYGCGVRLDLIGFVGLNLVNEQFPRGDAFWQVLEWIADTGGLPRPIRDAKVEARHTAIRSNSETYEALFQQSLEHADTAVKYMEGRGFRDEDVRDQVGYLPAKSVPLDEAAARVAGLYSQKGNYLWRDRIVFPIRRYGQIVSLCGRALNPKTMPKYLYPATTEPPMPAAVWGLDQVPQGATLHLTEGIIDAWTLTIHGYHGITAGGTQRVTNERIELIKSRKPRSVVVIGDAEISGEGRKAAVRNAVRLFRAGLDGGLIDLSLPEGKQKEDPNSYFLEHTRDDFEALPVVEFFDCILQGIPTTGTLYEKRAAVMPVIELVAARDDELLDAGLLRKVHDRAPEFKFSLLEKRVCELRREKPDLLPVGSDFRPDAYADTILSSAHIIHYSGEFYFYEGGVYRPVPEAEVKRIIQDLGRGFLRKNQIEDALHSLSIKTFHRPEKVNEREYINVRNGLMNITAQDFELLPHSPAFLSTLQLPLSYDEAAEGPQFKAFLNQSLPERRTQATVQEFIGYVLTPDSSLGKALFLPGPTATGKSTFLAIVTQMVGPENVSNVSLERLGDKFAAGGVIGKLVNITTEFSAKEFVEDGLMKALITGDRVQLEKKYQQAVNIKPYIRIVAAANDMILSRDVSTAFFRRWLVVPFNRRLPSSEQDPQLAERIIEQELSAVFLWALAGLARLRQNRTFTLSETSIAALEAWKQQLDPVMEFKELFLTHVSGTSVSLQSVFQQYNKWCDRTNRQAKFTDSNFRQRLESLGVPFKRKNRGWSMEEFSLMPDIPDASDGNEGRV